MNYTFTFTSKCAVLDLSLKIFFSQLNVLAALIIFASDGRARYFAAVGPTDHDEPVGMPDIRSPRTTNRKCTYGASLITVGFDTGTGTEHAQCGVKRSQPLPVRHI